MQAVLAFLKKHRRLFQLAGLCLALFAVFAAVWLTEIRGKGEKSSNWALNDQFHSYAVIEKELVQTFRCDRDLLALSLVLAAEDTETPPEGELELTLADAATGEVLAASTGDMRYIYNGWEAYYTTLGLDRFVQNPGQWVEYTLTLTPRYEGAGRLCVGYEAGGMPAGVVMSIDGEEVDGTVALLGVQARVGGFLTAFYWIFAAGCIGAAALLFWLYAWQRAKLHHLVFCAALLLGFAFNVLLPPYAAPDEKYHINQSFTLASTIYDPDLPVAQSHIHNTIRRPSDVDALLQVDETTVFTWQHILKVLSWRNGDAFGDTASFPEYQVDSNYTLYWVSGLGVLLGFYLRLGFAATLYLGRLANLLFFAFLAAWAVKKTPVAKPVFAAAALLPMTLHLAASYSRDSNLLAICFLFSALALDLAFGPRKALTWRQLALPAVLGFILAPCKMVYMPLCLLFLFIPAARLGRFAPLIKGGLVALCLFSFLSNTAIGLSIDSFTKGNGEAAAGAVSSAASDFEPAAAPEAAVSQATAAAEPAAAPETADGSAGAGANSMSTQADSICFSLPYILAHPLDTVELCIRSLVREGDHYLNTLVGGTLGYFGLDRPLELAWGWVVLLYGLLAAAWLCPDPGAPSLPAGARWIAALAALACCGLAVLGCISWTPTYYEIIYGFQGRYFLPVLPLLLLSRPKHLVLAGDCRRGLVLALALADIGVLLNVFLAVSAR